MSVISNTILIYFCHNFDQLNADQKFHFASRIYLWNDDPEMEKELSLLRPWFSSGNNARSALAETLNNTTGKSYGSRNVASLREPYFNKYPNLGVYTAVLFRALFLETVYGINCRQEAAELLDKEKLDMLAKDLIEDKAALAMLSTHAVNFLYLYFNLIRNESKMLPIKKILDSYAVYDFFDPLQLQLYLYLNTHCVIADSLYYSREIPADNIGIYKQVARSIEDSINIHYPNVNLDNKLEFLVCCRLLGQKSRIETRIIDEAEKSLSDKGSYIIDKLNNNPQSNNIDIAKSEHRNVLFILCQSPFRPHGHHIST